MCGIFGWISKPATAAPPEVLARLTDLMTHRGPDGGGYWQGLTQNEKYQIAFGHRRLSIIDVSSAGAQPMWSHDGKIVVTYNGEIYNHVELRSELEALGHTFRSASDTEILIESYRQWGDACFGRFQGMFALALFDTIRQRVVLARDPFGKKPLFLVDRPGLLLFASEIAPLIEYPGVSRNIDWASLDEYLLNRFVPGPATFFHDIKKLSPGSIGIWQDGAWTTNRYFSPPIGNTEPDATDFAAAVREFAQTFDDAVRIRMRSDVPFGAFLSGGIDSAAVVATMTRHSREAIRTFSVGFKDHDYSELPAARDVVDAFQTRHHELIITPADYLAAWPEALMRRCAPVSEPADIPVMLLAHAARSSVKMVLTGEGADELLAGYPKHRAEQWTGLYHALMPEIGHRSLVRPCADALPYSMGKINTLARALGERESFNRMRVWFGGISTAERDRLTNRQIDTNPRCNYPFSPMSGSDLRRTLFFDQTSWLPDNLLERGDRMMMAGSIEGRMPFMDTNVARLCARFSDKLLIRQGRGKSVLREAMRTILPASTLERKKSGFRVPINVWLRTTYRDQVLDHLGSSASETRRFLSAPALDQLITAHMDGTQNHERILWSLLNLEKFIRTFKPGLAA